MDDKVMIKVGVVGATGYAGEELIALLLSHPNVRITSLTAKIDKPTVFSDLFPRFTNRIDLVCTDPDPEKISRDCDLVFLALPHTVSMGIVPQLLKKGVKVIDLSADYRLKDFKVYEKFYLAKHKDKANIAKAVYGLPELYRYKIKSASFIANPGCYPTAAILGLSPLIACGLIDTDSVIIDAKSGVSGAGRKVAESFLFTSINEDFKAYKVNIHQHAPEIDMVLSRLHGRKLKVTFVPHLLPLTRGILETIYIRKSPTARAGNLLKLYQNFYKKEPFIRIKPEGQFPRIADVAGTNFCDIGLKDDGNKVIVISAIDNLLKGASGQAVQNMNIMYKLPEHSGLL